MVQHDTGQQHKLLPSKLPTPHALYAAAAFALLCAPCADSVPAGPGSHLGARTAGQRCDVDGLSGAPPAAVCVLGADGNVGEHNVGHIPAIPAVNVNVEAGQFRSPWKCQAIGHANPAAVFNGSSSSCSTAPNLQLADSCAPAQLTAAAPPGRGWLPRSGRRKRGRKCRTASHCPP